MAPRIKALVKPALLAWARRSSNLTVLEASLRAKVEQDDLIAWEVGSDAPSVPQLRKLAHVYKRPLAVFFLAEPPADFDPMRYFRRHPDTPEARPSPELTYAIRQAEWLRENALDLAEESGRDVQPLSMMAKLGDAPAAWAARARELLAISVERQLGWKDESEAWRSWRAALESLDIIVLQVPHIAVEEMRGFSVIADKLPLIAVNSADFVRARMFTAMHELAHIILRVGDVDRAQRFWVSDDAVEFFCNVFAGEVLVPRDALARESLLQEGDRESGAEATMETRRIAARFRVSEDVALRRLHGTTRVSTRFFDEHRQFLAKVHRKAKKPSGPIPIQQTILSRFGGKYVRTVLEALRRERITASDVSDFLGVKVAYLPRIERAAFGYE
jgi:Zn-dependent peptidase ImmA (M78 family)